MDSSFDLRSFDLLDLDPMRISEVVSGFTEGRLPLVLALAAVFLAWSFVSTYRIRRRKERRLTGRDSSLESMANMRPGRKRRAHEANPALPAVTVRRRPAPYKTISSARKLWWVAGEDYDEPQMVAIGMTGSGKNQTLLDPTAWNVIEHRAESAVVVDVKGDMIAEYARRARAPQYAYSFLETDKLSSAINLIATPKMAATTAAALYPVKGVKVPIFNQGARDLFEGLADALGHSESNMVELYRCLRNPKLMSRLAKNSGRLSDAVSGENRKFVSDVVTSARLPLAPLERPEVARVFAPAPDTPQPGFLDKEIVWLCIPQDDPAIALLAGAISDNLYNRATASRRGTYFLIDEAGSCLTIENLAKYLSIGRGLGAYFFLVLQDVSQLQARIGSAETRSVLGSAGVQFWGKSQDTETARYVSALSGMVRVSWAVYEDEGSERAWKQMFSAAGAPYKMEDRDREGILPEHVHGLPKGWWYAFDGDPHRVRLLIPAPMREWSGRALPEPSSCEILGIPEERDSGATPNWITSRPRLADGSVPEHEQTTESDVAVEERAEDPEWAEDPEQEAPPDGRVCPACESAVAGTARFCEGCGTRL